MLDLKAALGIPAGETIELPGEELLLKNSPAKRIDVPESIQMHPDVKAAEVNILERKAQEAVEKAGYLPKISGAADYGANGNEPGRDYATYNLGLELSWPLFEAGERQARVAEAESKTREAKTNFNDVKNQKEAKAFEARNSLKDARFYLLAKSDNLFWRKKELDLAKRRFGNGTASDLERVRELQSAADAENDAADAAALYRTAQINLAHALGQMEKFLEKK